MVLGYHSTTSMAVKAVVVEVKKQLSKKFNFLQGMPEFFYDFDKGLSKQFQQYYAKIPERDRSGEWIALSYSYDSASRSTIQPRNGLKCYRPVAQHLKRQIDFQYVELPLLFSVLTNNSKCLNGLSNFIGRYFDWSFSVDYQDLLWPQWVSNQNIPLGWYIRPTEPNGALYMCSKMGLSGTKEPNWDSTFGSITIDNGCEWTCVRPDLLRVKAGSFVKNDTTIQNPIDNGIMYQYDFGFTLHYTDYDDAGELVGVITKAVLNLLSLYDNKAFSETIVAPEQ